MTCATIGRPEHGTERTTPGDSPLTIAKGWTYYRNLISEDFESALALSSMFSEFTFVTQGEDLYFYGLKA